MKPFGALKFCTSNPGRVLTLVAMIMLTGLLYVGGSYLTNIEVETIKVLDVYRDFTYIKPKSGDLEAEYMAKFLQETRSNPSVRIIPAGGNEFRYPTTFGFSNGDTAWCFTPEDFIWVNERLSLVNSATGLESDTLILSQREAKYLKLSESDIFEKNRDEACFYYGSRPYKIRLTSKDAFFACLLSEEAATSNWYMASFTTPQDEEAYKVWEASLQEKYPQLRITTGESRLVDCERYFDVNRFIFLSIITVVSCVFFITINAVLVGIYEKRKNEFLLYSRIGIPRKKVYGKVIRELLLISGTGMVLGFLLSMGSITFINRFLYLNQGLQLYYYHPWSLWSWLICNALILLPSMILRLRFVRLCEKEDI